MKISLIPLFLIFCISFSVNGQSLDDLIELNKQNLANLLSSRGFTDEWVKSGNVSQSDLINSLKKYDLNVGLLIYNHIDDTLNIVLMDKHGKIYKNKRPYLKDSLVDQVNKANRWFSREASSRIPSKRGIKLSSSSEEKSVYKVTFESINNTLLPFSEKILMEFDHLIIVPTLNLSILPFSAFKLADNKFLIDIMSYSIAPSLYELMVAGQMKVNRGLDDSQGQLKYTFTNALFVANPEFPMDDIWNFPDLPGTLEEVNYITKQLDSTSYTKLEGKNATTTNIYRNICDYDLLYFATHGISDLDNPLDKSFLVLAKDPNGNFLTARNIQDIRKICILNADLVILSACQTGLGKEHEGGIIGLARAFQIAGANHVLMSLWSISDKETAILMGFFFDYLQTGGNMMPHEALRSAILKYKNEINDNPNYWAAFSIFGIPF